MKRDWSDAEREIVVRGLQVGESALVIASHLSGWSRNAVIGFIHRHLPDAVGRKPAPREKRPAQPRSPAPRRARPSRPATLPATEEPAPAPLPAPSLKPKRASGPCYLMDLRDRDCRWPVSGDRAQTRFCGELAADANPYCEYHCRLAYNRSKERAA